jgi:hypothetical protein
MFQFLAEVALYEVPRVLGWALLRVVTLGRYRRRTHPEGWSTGAEIVEPVVGFSLLAGVTWLSMR